MCLHFLGFSGAAAGASAGATSLVARPPDFLPEISRKFRPNVRGDGPPDLALYLCSRVLHEYGRWSHGMIGLVYLTYGVEE